MDKENYIKTWLTILFCIITAILAGVFSAFFLHNAYTQKQETNAIQRYCSIAETNVDAMFDEFNEPAIQFDVNAYKRFERSCLGNTSVNLLSYGTYCEKDGLISEATNHTILHEGEKEIQLDESPSSYINIMDGFVYYRPDDTRHLYRYSIEDGSSECVIEQSCSEAVVNPYGIAYINYVSGELYFRAFDSEVSQRLTDFAVTSFAMIGSDYLCLRKDKILGILKNSGEFEQLLSNVDRFYNVGKIVAQKKSNLYMIDASGITELSFNSEMDRLIGFDGTSIYLQDENAVYRVSADAAPSSYAQQLLLDQNEILKSLCFSDTYAPVQAIIYSTESEPYLVSWKPL